MFPLTLRRSSAKSAKAKADPAPSRWSWRMQRLMLTPGFRLGLRAGVPFCLTLMAATIYLSSEERREAIALAVSDARRSIEERPEFMVKLMAVDGATGALAANVRALVPVEFPASSFDLDVTELRQQITDLDGVKNASVRIKPGGILQVDVTPRIPVAVWRTEDELVLVDEGGARVEVIGSRGARLDLPLIAGPGAEAQVPQALRLINATAPIGKRLRGLVRVGERRWDVVLDRDQRIMLPETGAVQALERVIALEGAQEVLSRDVLVVDMRLAQRPTVRMSEEATKQWWQIKQISGQ
ncbi:cell division protein FtsQ/DivIB [Sulfitobacter mediterraneus]|uniref:cell division protein FtsQ/DivIB n=1 Tax=Sulfitobacter mediterraneus TaxID=83219 RepID=UPI00249242A7|nr:cell division protein FtsQ/DivIB [Sulfitobacter mediterraneus]